MTTRAVRSWRAFLGAAAGLVATLACSVALASPAAAHAALIGTDPADGAVLPVSPDGVTLTFNEPVVLTPRGIEVLDAAGSPVASTARTEDALVEVDLGETLGAGTYVLAWRVVSADGHPLSGSVTFSVERPSAAVDVRAASAEPAATDRLRATVQGLEYVGLLLLAGLAVFATWILPARARARIPRRLGILGGVAAGLALLAAAALVPLSGAVRLGRSASAVATDAAWDPGLVGNELLALGLVSLGCAIAAGALALPAGPTGRARRAVLLLGAALALGAPTSVGHTRSRDPQALLVLADLTHLAAGAVWFGGLVGLVLVLPGLSRHDGLAAEVLSRFSAFAAVTLVALVAMGGVLSWRILGSWDNLVHSAYGLLLLAKVAIVLAAVAVASANRFLLLPRVRGATRRRDARRASRLTRRAVAGEAALLAVVLLVTGFLTGQTPHDAASSLAQRGVLSRTVTVDDLQVLARLTADAAGPNTIEVELHDRAGRPVETAGPPSVSVRSTRVDLGTVPVTTTGKGAYRAPVVLPAPGRWEVQVSVPLSAFERPVTTLALTVAG